MNIRYFALIAFLLSFLFSSCKEGDSGTIINPPVVGTATLSGVLKYYDNTPAEGARVELKNANGIIIIDTCSATGAYSYNGLVKGDYTLTFRSTGPEVNGSSATVTIGEGSKVTKDLIVTFHVLDKFAAFQVSDSVAFIRFAQDGAKIGNNFDKIDHFSGSYFRDYQNKSTLSFDIYKIPDTLNWYTTGVNLTTDYIRTNFTLVTSLEEQSTLTNGFHELLIAGADIPKILSNPSNGFALIRKIGESRALKIPCYDYANSSYGLQIWYK